MGSRVKIKVYLWQRVRVQTVIKDLIGGANGCHGKKLKQSATLSDPKT
jgi:hypothetical protein